MAEEPSKLHGAKDKVVGALKETTGKVLGSETLQTEGHSQYLHGVQELEAARTHQSLKGATEQATGATKEGLGKATGDTELQTEGVAEKVKGDIRDKTNV